MEQLMHAAVIVRNAISTCFEGYLADRRAALSSEDGGIGMQAAIVTGGLVAIAVAITLVLRNRATTATAQLTVPATVTATPATVAFS